MKKLNFVGLSVATVLALVGCGGGGSSDDVKTGTGYYVDNAVAGVDYVCGSQTAKTGADGKFTFEEGKECKFSLAGIPLRTTQADELTDGKKVLEDNPKVAKLLQSIDADGDLSNGIQVTDEVVEALTKALEETQSTGKLPEGDRLTEVVANVGHDVAGVSGDVRTDEEVHAHLTQTQTEITKELLAGKTFYVVGEEEDKFVIFKIVVNAEATAFESSKLDGTDINHHPVNIDGNRMIFTNDTDGSYTLVSQKDGYIFADDRNADGTKDAIGHRLYDSQSDAQAYFDSLNDDNSVDNSLSASSLKAYFSGKTFYMIDDENCDNSPCENTPEIAPVIFNADATTLQVGTNDTPWAITIEDGKIVDEEGNHFIDEITDTYVKGHDSYGEFIFYVNRDDAQAALDIQGN